MPITHSWKNDEDDPQEIEEHIEVTMSHYFLWTILNIFS